MERHALPIEKMGAEGWRAKKIDPATDPASRNHNDGRCAHNMDTNARIFTVAEVLQSDTDSTIKAWFGLLQAQQKLSCVPMSYEQRCAHLPQVFRDLVLRLQSSQEIGHNQRPSATAAEHGRTRYRQGYSAAMLVEESRILQVSIFQTLHRNLDRIDPEVVLLAVMAIADEVDSQLSQAVASFTLASAG